MRIFKDIILDMTAKSASKLLLLLIIISIYVPFSPKMPAPGLDSSWALGLNQAVAQGLAFGKEIIFTLGPYSSIYTKAYHPATDLMMMSGSIYLALSYWVALLCLMNRLRLYWILSFCVVFLVMLYSRDALMFSYPLLVGIISSKHQLLYSKKTLFLFAILFAPFGLLVLVKGSLLILCLLMTVLCFTFFLAYNRKSLAMMCLASPTVSTLLFWLAAKQSLIYLPHYFISSLFIAGGFTEAMSADGNAKEIILYLVSSVLILVFIMLQKKTSSSAKLFLLSIFFVFLFISFKTGFTRHLGHALIPGTSILLAAFFLPFIFNSRRIYLPVLSSLISWYCINSYHTKISLHDNFRSVYSSTWHGLKNRILNPSWLYDNFTFTLDFLNTQAAFPIMHGTTDIYSYNQSYLISSQNQWSPRPVFQSYSVFTPYLAQANKEHLQETNSPDNIIFKIEPIDNRVPSLEDGASWPLLLTNYHPARRSHGFLILQKNTVHPNKLESDQLSEQHLLGEQVNVPAHQQTLFASIEMKSTLWGSLATLFYKPSQLHISFVLNDGTKKQYRLIASMANSLFLLSPLIENTSDFSLLYKNNDELTEKKVKSFIVTANNNLHWDKIYNIKFLIHHYVLARNNIS